MAKTKQTARKVDQPGRQAGMEPAVLEPQHEEVPEEEEVAQGEAQEGAQKGTEEVEVVQPDEQVTGEQDPIDPAAQPGPSTSTAPVVSASTGTLDVVAYMNKCQELARVWFEEVVKKKEVAYRDLIASLVSLVEEQSKTKDLQIGLVGFSGQQVVSVLESISDTSGKYIDSIDRFQLEVSKEEEEITRKRFTESKKASAAQKALDEYYDAAKDLCQAQAMYMVKLEKLSKTLDNPDRLLAIINHVQLPAVQVTVTTREQDKKQAGVSGEEMVILEHLPEAETWKVGRAHSERMMAAWLYFVLHKQVTGSTAGQDRCADKFGCSVTQFKRMVTGKWQEGGKRKEEPKSTSKATRKRKSERIEKLAKEERGDKKKPKRKAKVIHIAEDDDEEDDD